MLALTFSALLASKGSKRAKSSTYQRKSSSSLGPKGQCTPGPTSVSITVFRRRGNCTTCIVGYCSVHQKFDFPGREKALSNLFFKGVDPDDLPPDFQDLYCFCLSRLGFFIAHYCSFAVREDLRLTRPMQTAKQSLSKEGMRKRLR